MNHLFTSTEPEEGGFIYQYPPSEKYEDGVHVHLSARPATGWEFSHWSICCWGDRAIIKTTGVLNQDIIFPVMNDKAVAAHFIEGEKTPSWTDIVRDAMRDQAFRWKDAARIASKKEREAAERRMRIAQGISDEL
jgi:hypothetical protein